MFVRKFLLIGSVILLLLGISTSPVLPSKPTPLLGGKFEPVDAVLKPGLVKLELELHSRFDWGKLKFKVLTIGNLVYRGPASWEKVINKWDTVIFPLDVFIPPDDTVGIRIEIFKDSGLINSPQRFFTTTDDTVKLFGARPVPYKGSRRLIGIPDSLYVDGVAPLRFQLDLQSMHRATGDANLILRIWSLLDWGETTIRLVFADRLQYNGPTEWKISLAPGDSLKYDIPVVIPPDDTTGIQFELITEDHKMLTATRYFVTTGEDLEIYQSKPRPGRRRPRPEGSPWVPPPDFVPDTTKINEIHRLPDSVIERLREENLPQVEILKAPDYFPKPQTDDHILDSLREAAPDKAIETILDLRDPEHCDYAKDNIDNLIEMDSLGFYRAFITRDQAAALSRKGIPLEKYPEIPSENNPREHDLHNALPRRNQPPEPLKIRGQWDLIYEYGFEDGLGPHWYSYDTNDTSGQDYWDTISVYESWGRASEGFFSAWCSRIGSRPVINKYDTYMDSWLNVGFLLPDYDYLLMEFDIWYNTDEDYDGCVPYYRINSGYWYPVEQYEIYTGSSSGWLYEEAYAIEKDLLDTVYIGFRFLSDLVYTYEGVFIDNFKLWGWNDAQPDLTPYTPSGWSGPIVPDAQTGTNWSNNLWASKPTYIDFCIKNIGSAPAPPFQAVLYLDGNPYKTYTSPGNLAPDGIIMAIDEFMDGPYGLHELKIVADFGNDVVESDEYNNEYSDYFYWDSQEVRIDGYIYYQDMGNMGMTQPARKIYAELWDANSGNPDVLLGSCFTTDWGQFDFPAIKNYDTHGTGEIDPYLKVYASNYAATVFLDTLFSAAQYTFNSDTLNNIKTDTSITITADSIESGPLFAVDNLLDALDEWNSLYANSAPMVGVYLGNLDTEYKYGFIRIDTTTNVLQYTPDTFDRAVILHEYGHRLEFNFGFLRDTLGGPHTWFSLVRPSLASCEAFAHFWSSFTRGNPSSVDTYDNFSQYMELNIENGEVIKNGSMTGSVNSLGKCNEGAVAGMFWDIFDNISDDYDGDGVGDDFNAGINDLMDVIFYMKPDSCDEFWDDWFTSGLGNNDKMWAIWYEHGDNKDFVAPTGTMAINNGDSTSNSLIVELNLNITDTLSGLDPSRAGMRFSNDNNTWTGWESYNTVRPGWDLRNYGGNSNFGIKTAFAQVRDATQTNVAYFSDQIEILECVPGDANGDGSVNIADAAYMINYVFEPNPPAPTPYPIASGDANGDCSADVGDAVWIISYIFKSGPAPVDCNTWIANCGLPIRK